MTTYSTKRRVLKNEARNYLFASFYKSCLLTTFMFFVTIGFSSVLKFIVVVFGNIISLRIRALLFVLAVLLISPLYLGYLRVYADFGEEKKIHIGDLFYYYASHKRFSVSLKASFSCFLILGAFVVLMRAIPKVSDFLIINTQSTQDSIRPLLLVLVNSLILFGVFILLLILCTALTVFCFSSYNTDDQKYASRLRFFLKNMKKHHLEYFVFCISFVPVFFMSYFTMGILYIVTIPYFLLSVCAFVNYVNSEKSVPEPVSFS